MPAADGLESCKMKVRATKSKKKKPGPGVAGETNPGQSIPDAIKTRSVLIYDDFDRLRMSLAAHGGVEPKISLYKEDGTPAIEISSLEMDLDSRRIVLFGKRHTWQLIITSNENGVGMTAFDENGKHTRSLIFFEEKKWKRANPSKRRKKS